MLVARLSLRPELAAEREVLMVSSSAGMVLVSSRQGTVPLSFSSSICGGETRTGLEAGRPIEFLHKYTFPQIHK